MDDADTRPAEPAPDGSEANMHEIKLPGFSLAERDRRYGAVRRAMAASGLDCVIAPQNPGEWDACQADARYLTSIGGGGTAVAALLAAEGPVIAIVRDARRTEFWKSAQAWVSDVRGTPDGGWGAALVQAVGDLGCESGRIGIAGLRGVLRFPDGTVTHGEVMALSDAFPQATFEDATLLMHDIRMIKSAEEIAMIERAQGCADAISEAAFETARPGVTEHELHAAMMAAHIRSGGEVPAMLMLGIGAAPKQTFLLPTMRALEPSDILILESEVKYGGYMAQSIEALSLGPPPAEYQRLYDASLACFDLLLGAAKPGVPHAELIRLWDQHMRSSGLQAAPTIGHGLGMGQDGPSTSAGGAAQGRVIAAGQCFILKPWATSADGERAIRAGNSIVIEDDGARRLGRLEMAFRQIG
jgi:Xaa-Pro aminopeptidase